MPAQACLSDAELIRHAAGADDARLQQHLAECETCRARLRSICAVNALLDQWQVVPPPTDLVAGVLARSHGSASPWRWRVRVAAAVLLCGVAGYIAGQASRPAPVRPSDDAVALALGLDALAEQTDLLGTIDWSQ